jgi:peptidoglycan/LPS O-acetylase OafA/YrhL
VALRYRADLDGLRGIAVICVVLFHAHTPLFLGGYVGVDVFFVISGYLITMLLAGSGPGRPWSWVSSFYLRRARRILPALLVTAAVAAAVAPVLLLPLELMDFGKFLTVSVALAGNLGGWTHGDGDYFNTGSPVPLLHLWSIGVEEQFYLAYPLALLLLTRYLPRHRLLAIAVLATASFALCVWGSAHKPSANFYLPPFRAWELLFGAVVALGEPHWRLPYWTRQALAALAVAILAVTVGTYGVPELPYPGVATLAPCAATAILIATGGEQATAVARLLGAPPLVFTGLVSYSLYLWHLPIFVLLECYHLDDLGAAGFTVLLVAIYAVAVISWRFIERPVRTGAFLQSRRMFLITAAAASAALLATGIAFWSSRGLPERFSRADLPDMGPPAQWLCTQRTLAQVADGELCSYGPATEEAPRALVWGDSHAVVLMPAYEQLARSHHIRVYFAVRLSCLPLLGVSNLGSPRGTRERCKSFNTAVVDAITRLKPGLVILNGRWIDKDADLLLDSDSDLPRPEGTSNFRLSLQQTLQQIDGGGGSVCAVLDVPAYKQSVPRYLLVTRLRGLSTDALRLRRAEALQHFEVPERDFRSLERAGKLRTVDPKDALCQFDSCALVAKGSMLYGDSQHLSPVGARLVMSTLERCFSSAVQSKDSTSAPPSTDRAQPIGTLH